MPIIIKVQHIRNDDGIKTTNDEAKITISEETSLNDVLYQFEKILRFLGFNVECDSLGVDNEWAVDKKKIKQG